MHEGALASRLVGDGAATTAGHLLGQRGRRHYLLLMNTVILANLEHAFDLAEAHALTGLALVCHLPRHALYFEVALDIRQQYLGTLGNVDVHDVLGHARLLLDIQSTILGHLQHNVRLSGRLRHLEHAGHLLALPGARHLGLRLIALMLVSALTDALGRALVALEQRRAQVVLLAFVSLIAAASEEAHARAQRMRRIARTIEATLVRELRLDILLGRVVDEVGEQLRLLRLAIVAKVLMHGRLEADTGTSGLVVGRVHALLINRITVAIHLMIDACAHGIIRGHAEVHVGVELLRRYFTEVTVLCFFILIEFLKLRKFTSHV